MEGDSGLAPMSSASMGFPLCCLPPRLLLRGLSRQLSSFPCHPAGEYRPDLPASLLVGFMGLCGLLRCISSPCDASPSPPDPGIQEANMYSAVRGDVPPGDSGWDE